MIASYILAAFVYMLTVRADVYPYTPPMGVPGEKCQIAWRGDTDPTTLAAGAWTGMNVELMTGSNSKMVHLTTVAWGLDGDYNGTVEYVCPDVTPYSTIYFLQFTSPNTKHVLWSTRFAIAPSPESVTGTPNTDGSVGWGNGQLVDPSTAEAAPPYETTVAARDVSPTPLSVTTAASVTTSASSSSATSSRMVKSTTSASSSSTSTSSSDGSTSTSTSSTSAKPSKSNGAVNAVAIDFHFIQFSTVLFAFGMGFAVLL